QAEDDAGGRNEDRCGDEDGERGHERRRRETAPTQNLMVLPHHPHLPKPVVEVLPKHAPVRASGRVDNPDPRIEEHASTRMANPERELVVLIAKQGFVEEPDSLEGLRPKRTVGEDVGVTANCLAGRAHPTDPAEWAVHRACDCALRPRSAFGDDDPPDCERVGFFRGLCTEPEVVVRVSRMKMEPYEEVPGRGADACVQPRRAPPGGVRPDGG